MKIISFTNKLLSMLYISINSLLSLWSMSAVPQTKIKIKLCILVRHRCGVVATTVVAVRRVVSRKVCSPAWRRRDHHAPDVQSRACWAGLVPSSVVRVGVVGSARGRLVSVSSDVVVVVVVIHRCYAVPTAVAAATIVVGVSYFYKQ